MKGLLLKDLYTLTKQMKSFLFIIVVWTLIPGFSASSFAIIYTGMLPITALAYDERCKWNSLAAMMPYSAGSMVFSKYLLGYILISCASLLSVLAQVTIALLSKTPFNTENLITVAFTIPIALIIQAINLPVMFRLGVEKGRYVFFVLVAIFVVGGTVFGEKLIPVLANLTIAPELLIFDIIIAVVIINVASIWISTRVYAKKAN